MSDLKSLIETYAAARYQSGAMNYSGSPETQEVATAKVRAAGEALNKALDPENLARRFHDTYERLAPSFGYTTRPETRDFEPTTPNGRLMLAVCAELVKGSDGVWASDAHKKGPSDTDGLERKT